MPRPYLRNGMSENIFKIGLVSYLNACPLGHGLSDDSFFNVQLVPPSWLASMLENEIVDVALVPVVDYLGHQNEWEICVPYGICSSGEVWTVRIFSPVPIGKIETLIVDIDSHTSIALAEILIHRLTGKKPELQFWDFSQMPKVISEPSLLIGDKAWQVKNAKYIYDLGELWREQFKLPFVYAVWCSRKDKIPQTVKNLLVETAKKNLERLEELAGLYGPAHGFSVDDAFTYFSRIIHYPIGLQELAAINRFKECLECRE